jgi:hypothetical protein
VHTQLVSADEALPPAAVGSRQHLAQAVLALRERITVDELVTSGYLASEPPELAGYTHVERLVLEGWAADLHRRA